MDLIRADMTNPTSYSINHPLLKLLQPSELSLQANPSPKLQQVELGHKVENETQENVQQGHVSKVLSCEQCDYKTGNRRHMSRHIDSVHKKLKNFACEQCDHRTSQKDLLNRHVKAIHDKIKDWECGQCSFKSSRGSALRDHVKSMHEEKVRDLACSKCKYRAFKKRHLRAHIMAVHLKKNKNLCGSHSQAWNDHNYWHTRYFLVLIETWVTTSGCVHNPRLLLTFSIAMLI